MALTIVSAILLVTSFPLLCWIMINEMTVKLLPYRRGDVWWLFVEKKMCRLQWIKWYYLLVFLFFEHNPMRWTYLLSWPSYHLPLKISMISSLLVTNKENIRKYYQDPKRYLQSITITNYDKAHSFNYQLNLPSIVTECDDLPQDLFPREECIQSLLDYKRVSEISLMNYLVVKRTPGQVVRVLSYLYLFAFIIFHGPVDRIHHHSAIL